MAVAGSFRVARVAVPAARGEGPMGVPPGRVKRIEVPRPRRPGRVVRRDVPRRRRGSAVCETVLPGEVARPPLEGMAVAGRRLQQAASEPMTLRRPAVAAGNAPAGQPSPAVVAKRGRSSRGGVVGTVGKLRRTRRRPRAQPPSRDAPAEARVAAKPGMRPVVGLPIGAAPSARRGGVAGRGPTPVTGAIRPSSRGTRSHGPVSGVAAAATGTPRPRPSPMGSAAGGAAGRTTAPGTPQSNRGHKTQQARSRNLLALTVIADVKSARSGIRTETSWLTTVVSSAQSSRSRRRRRSGSRRPRRSRRSLSPTTTAVSSCSHHRDRHRARRTPKPMTDGSRTRRTRRDGRQVAPKHMKGALRCLMT